MEIFLNNSVHVSHDIANTHYRILFNFFFKTQCHSNVMEIEIHSKGNLIDSDLAPRSAGSQYGFF